VRNLVKDRNPEETRREILRAADTLIRRRGLARVTTREIAREAGCADGTLYKHFGTKEDLFLAVIFDALPQFDALLRPGAANESNVAERLNQIATAALRFFEQVLPHGVALLADSQLLSRHRERLTNKSSGPQILYSKVAAYIEAEQSRGHLNPVVQPSGAAALILGPCFQWVLTRMINGTGPLPITETEFVSLVTRGLLEGLAPQTRS